MRNYRSFKTLIFGILCIVFLVSCKSEKDSAKNAIESYILALSNKDSAQISNLSCADWEQNALMEVDSLTAVGSTVENLACVESAQENDLMFVTCSGSLVLDYNGEAQQIDLSNRTYIARKEDGEWRMCGYK
jgi:hypothetical protein